MKYYKLINKMFEHRFEKYHTHFEMKMTSLPTPTIWEQWRVKEGGVLQNPNIQNDFTPLQPPPSDKQWHVKEGHWGAVKKKKRQLCWIIVVVGWIMT